MDVRAVIERLDRCFAREDLAGARALLEGALEEARRQGDTSAAIGLYNEMMGFERQYGAPERARAAAENALALLETAGFADSRPAAMVFLNAATVMKRFGGNDAAAALYARAEALFDRYYPAGSPEFAGLYNNMAALYLDTGAYEKAEYYYERAAALLRRAGDDCDLAVTYWNLALLYDRWRPLEAGSARCAETAQRILNGAARRDAYYYYTCRKCAGAAAELGYFEAQRELNERADAFYAGR